jgi:putative membrane protein
VRRVDRRGAQRPLDHSRNLIVIDCSRSARTSLVYAAWVRTGLVAMASGIGAKALLAGVLPQWLVILTGSVLVLFSVFCFGAAVWRHLYPGPPPPVPDAARIHPALLVSVNGFLAMVSILALIGVWFGYVPG